MEQQIGTYRIESELGRGGMGVVYRATDTKLGRTVAIKALPEAVATEPSRLDRFEREARTLASLNHPNVAQILGIEQQDGRSYLVLEFVDGVTLGERLDQGPLVIDEAVEVCAQIALGLEAAHEAGIIHRDLKPANIKITPDDTVKLLDFGLAKSDTGTLSSGGLSESPTLTSAQPQHSPTIPGAILGTAAYMSPEQARGRSIDKRTDVWSFGVVLYECLVGISPFQGETATDSIGAILHKDPELDRLPPATPDNIRRVLRRCLQRDRSRRARDIADIRLEMIDTEARAEPSSEVFPRGVLPIAGAVAIAGIVLGAGMTYVLTRTPSVVAVEPEPTRRYSIMLPEDAPLAPSSAHEFGIARAMFDISPDGSTLVYTGLREGIKHLFRRDMGTGAITVLPGTEHGYSPFFSPDGSSIGFVRDDQVLRLSLSPNSRPDLITNALWTCGAIWHTDGNIYAGSDVSPFFVVPASGGEPTPIGPLDARASMVGWPWILPGDECILLTLVGASSGSVALDLDGSSESFTLPMVETDARYVERTGHLLFGSGSQVRAVAFDPQSLEVSGETATLLSGVRSTFWRSQYALAGDGTLVYAPGIDGALSTLVWVDSEGDVEDVGIPLARYHAFRISPDGSRVAIPVDDGKDTDIWIYEFDRIQAPQRVTFGGDHNTIAWSPDGRLLFYSRLVSNGAAELCVRDVQSSSPPSVLHTSPQNCWPLQIVGTDTLLFGQLTSDGAADIFVGTLERLGSPDATLTGLTNLSNSPHHVPFASVSPDGKWIVSNSDETGRWELFLSTYPDMMQRSRVSTSGGEEPYWTHDGQRIIYRWNDTWFEVDFESEPTPTTSDPRVLARGPYINVSGYSWDKSPDGSRLLLLANPDQDRAITRLEVITNFYALLNERLPQAVP